MKLEHAPICEAGITPALLARWQDGALSVAEAERVRAHVAGCVACQKRLTDYAGIRRAFAAQPAPEPNVGGWSALRSRIERPDARRPVRSVGRGRLWQRAAALAAVLFLIAGFAGVLISRAGTSSSGAAGDVSVSRCPGIHAVPAAAISPSSPSVYFRVSLGSLGQLASNLYAFSPTDGVIRWCDRFASTRHFGCPPAQSCPLLGLVAIGQPLASGDSVYVCVGDGASNTAETLALSARDGAVRWSRQTGCQLVSMPFEDNAAPVYANGVLYSGSYALRASDGHVLWRSSIAESFAGVAGDLVYAYSLSRNAVYALDAATGAIRWTYTTSPLSLASVPAVTSSTVYVTGLVGDEAPGPSPAWTPNPAFAPTQPDLFALDATTGTLRWHAAVAPIAGAALEYGGLVYIGARDAVSALDAATGNVRWRLPLPLHAASTARLDAAGALYFSADGVYAVNAATGRLRWHTPLGYDQSISFGDVVLLDDRLFVARSDGSGRGMLYALDLRTGRVVWQVGGLGQPGAPTTG
jgi:outer membrane protein assembly factor BamB